MCTPEDQIENTPFHVRLYSFASVVRGRCVCATQGPPRAAPQCQFGAGWTLRAQHCVASVPQRLICVSLKSRSRLPLCAQPEKFDHLASPLSNTPSVSPGLTLTSSISHRAQTGTTTHSLLESPDAMTFSQKYMNMSEWKGEETHRIFETGKSCMLGLELRQAVTDRGVKE